MEKTEKRVLTLDRYEHGVVINALNEMRNDLLEEERLCQFSVYEISSLRETTCWKKNAPPILLTRFF